MNRIQLHNMYKNIFNFNRPIFATAEEKEEECGCGGDCKCKESDKDND